MEETMTYVMISDLSGLDAGAYETLYRTATAERRARADRYRRREDALRCLAAGALLSHVLGTKEYLTEKGPDGKPYIPGKESFFYNLSHSGNWVAIAYGETEVGVDVEQMAWGPGKAQIARRFFTPEEQDFVFSREQEQENRFYRIWTGKESYLKYLGTGIQSGLDTFSILSPPPGVVFRTWQLSGCCLTLCCEDGNSALIELPVRELLTDPSE